MLRRCAVWMGAQSVPDDAGAGGADGAVGGGRATGAVDGGDKVSWHVSQAGRAWRKTPNRRGKREGGWRLVGCPLPRQSPWLNRIEPPWGHGKRTMVEPERKWHVDALQHRLCAYDDWELPEPMAQGVSWSCTRQASRG
jgi:hypothetical protein